jgi:hypothetical protein
MTARRVVVCAALLGGLSAGCGVEPPRVSGTVTFGGRPVPAGRVYFDPVAATNPGGVQGYGDIKDGAYDTADHGPSPGGVVVRVNGLGEPSAAYPGGRPLFVEFTEPFDVPAGPATKDVNVPASAAAKLPSRPAPPP